MKYKHDYDTILTRLITILQRLNDREHLNVNDLAKEFGVSSRTIYRDFTERLVSFPIQKVGKNWAMEDGFKLERSKSFEDELVLNIMEQMSENIGGLFSLKAKHLLSKIKNKEYNPIYTKIHMEDISANLESIQKLESAIKLKQKVKTVYKNDDGISNHILQPLRIVNYEGFWYLVAIVESSQKLKKYYLKNLSQIKVLYETFTYEKEIDDLLENSISVWFQKDTKPFEVKLYISPDIAKYFQRKPISKTQKNRINS